MTPRILAGLAACGLLILMSCSAVSSGSRAGFEASSSSSGSLGGGFSGAPGDLTGLPSNVGSVCGSRALVGTREQSFRTGACGIRNPVRLYQVAGVRLDTPILVGCDAARTFGAWTARAAKPAAERNLGQELRGMTMAPAYACRNMLHRANGKISEHAKGNALDVNGFILADGTRVRIRNSYYGSRYSGFLSSIRRSACGPFGTVIGPGSRDGQHEDHFHFDVARYPGGPVCR